MPKAATEHKRLSVRLILWIGTALPCLLFAGAILLVLLWQKPAQTQVPLPQGVVASHIDPEPEPIPLSAPVVSQSADGASVRPYKIIGAEISLSASGDQTAAVAQLISSCKQKGANALFVPAVADGSSLFSSTVLPSAEDTEALSKLISQAHQNGMVVVATLSPAVFGLDPANASQRAALLACTLELLRIEGLDGLFFDVDSPQIFHVTYEDYLANGPGVGYEAFRRQQIQSLLQDVHAQIEQTGRAVYFGLLERQAGSCEQFGDVSLLARGVIDALCTTPARISKLDAPPERGDLLALAHAQSEPIETVPALAGFLGAQDISEARLHAWCGVLGLPAPMSGGLWLATPLPTRFTTFEPFITLTGTSDPSLPFYVNGKPADRAASGGFSLRFDLSIGQNKITLIQEDQRIDFTVIYVYSAFYAVSPSQKQTYAGGTSLAVRAVARRGSRVQASLNGTDITLLEQPEQGDSVFSVYTGIFVLPGDLKNEQSIGKILFRAETDHGIDEFAGGEIIVLPGSMQDGYTVPSGGGYVDVGNTLIAEVEADQVETFTGSTVDDFSRPVNNYLPAGTLDYCSAADVVDAASGYTYKLLRYGKRVYNCDTKSRANGIKTYAGSLPQTNTIVTAQTRREQRHTYLIFDTLWKAPFEVTLGPQVYVDPDSAKKPDYSVASTTYRYIDITFCYAEICQGKVRLDADHPLFEKVEWIKNTSDFTLRLHLKKAGAFYGWSASYNANGQLVFSFLHPAKITQASNKYGADLTGVIVVLDAGHGGRDCGAAGFDEDYHEADLNLILAKKLEKKLRSIGATVYLTRTDDTAMTLEERVQFARDKQPDLFVSIHRNSSESNASKGYDSFYFTPYSKPLAQSVFNTTAKCFEQQNNCSFENFYVMRFTDCPSILTENGFVSNALEYSKLVTDAHNELCADAALKGIIAYLRAI